MELRMSAKERDRLKLVVQVEQKQLSRRQAAELLGLSERQMGRVLQRYRAEGDAGLVHRLRGRRSNRKIGERLRGRVVKRLRTRYSGFGPTLACEQLKERDGVCVSRETVRQWMVEEGLWEPRSARVQHRAWRERRACFGELVQMDTSEHDWFEGRGERAVLITLIDDATSRVFMRFYPSDTGAANREMVRDYIRRYGRPRALYTDKASHFVQNRPSDLEEDLAGAPAQTQLGRGLSELGIEHIRAHSPQAKGRVERCFGTCQDRLVKLLRLEGISDIASANAYLDQVFVPEWNRRFARQAREAVDAHRSRRGFDLEAILSHQERRSVANDYTVKHRGVRYQIARESVTGGLRRARVTVEERLDGAIRLRWRERYLKHRALPAVAAVGLRPPSASAGKGRTRREPTGWKPGPDHPWRKPNRRTLLHCAKQDIPTLR
jgi:transposase